MTFHILPFMLFIKKKAVCLFIVLSKTSSKYDPNDNRCYYYKKSNIVFTRIIIELVRFKFRVASLIIYSNKSEDIVWAILWKMEIKDKEPLW
jgi:hypothetical protein